MGILNWLFKNKTTPLSDEKIKTVILNNLPKRYRRNDIVINEKLYTSSARIVDILIYRRIKIRQIYKDLVLNLPCKELSVVMKAFVIPHNMLISEVDNYIKNYTVSKFGTK